LRVYEDEILPLVGKRLVEQVDRKILEECNAKPPEETSDELTSLKEQEQELNSRLEQGYRDFLSAPAHRKEKFEAILTEWEQEREKLHHRIQEHLSDEEASTPSVNWWQAMCSQLIWVLDGEGEWRETTVEDVANFFDTTIKGLNAIPEETKRHFPGFFDSEGNLRPRTYTMHEVVPNVVMEQVGFRNLLKRLRVRVAVQWKPRLTTKAGKSQESTRLSDVEVEIEIGGKRYSEQIDRSGKRRKKK
jgi:hypothetical protein